MAPLLLTSLSSRHAINLGLERSSSQNRRLILQPARNGLPLSILLVASPSSTFQVVQNHNHDVIAEILWYCHFIEDFRRVPRYWTFIHHERTRRVNILYI